MIRKCCVCKRVEEDGQWIGSTSADCRPVSHVYCPHCFEGFMERVERFGGRRSFSRVYVLTKPGLG